LGCSAPYFEQISAILVREGFIETKRGCNGGYSLAKGIESKTMWDIIEVFNDKSWESQGSILDELREKFIEDARATVLLSIKTPS